MENWNYNWKYEWKRTEREKFKRKKLATETKTQENWLASSQSDSISIYPREWTNEYLSLRLINRKCLLATVPKMAILIALQFVYKWKRQTKNMEDDARG